jgi:hypothetical protein
LNNGKGDEEDVDEEVDNGTPNVEEGAMYHSFDHRGLMSTMTGFGFRCLLCMIMLLGLYISSFSPLSVNFVCLFVRVCAAACGCCLTGVT